MENKNINIDDVISTSDKHGLHGHVYVYRRNKSTEEVSLWDDSDNIIPISGYQFVLMKMFGLHLDSPHKIPLEKLGMDTTLVTPDLNNNGEYKIGIDPNDYSTMTDDISSRHIVQGFMIGNGGGVEDNITTKNTDYSFIKLRNAIPFQQTQTMLPTSMANKYLGVLRQNGTSMTKSYFIKKFDGRPHIYHGWWKEDQPWDYFDPITPNDLGPNPLNGVGKTNRIESYVECVMRIDATDCVSYFNHNNKGINSTAMINELGLVAFDTVDGELSLLERAYDTHISKILKTVYDKSRTFAMRSNTKHLIEEFKLLYINTVKTPHPSIFDSKMEAFLRTIDRLGNEPTLTSDNDSIDWKSYQNELSNENNLGVEALYNQSGDLVYVSDGYIDIVSSESFSDLTTDEAERIKLITYYTFKPIPLDDEWEIIIRYRIYAN